MSTTTTITIPTGPVQAQLTFFQDPEDSSSPFNYVSTPPPGQPQRNFGALTKTLTINDVRGNEGAFTLDEAGFAALADVKSNMAYADFANDDVVRKTYYPEVESLLLGGAVPGSPRRVVIFDHTVRRTVAGSERAPVTRAHIDQTAGSTAARVRLHVPGEEGEELLAGRVRIINVWRPLEGPVRAFPLAMADSRSVRQEDLVGVEHRYPDRTGETAGVRGREGQRVAHSAFVDPRSAPEDGRESIEVRALVFG
jgi:hypothetical protein